MEFIYKHVFAAFIRGVKSVEGGGGSTEIFEINLLRTWCVYTESRISRKNDAQDSVLLAFAGR